MYFITFYGLFIIANAVAPNDGIDNLKMEEFSYLWNNYLANLNQRLTSQMQTKHSEAAPRESSTHLERKV